MTLGRLRFAPVSLLMHPRLEPVRRSIGAYSPLRLALKGRADAALDVLWRASGRSRRIDALADAIAPVEVLVAGIYVRDPGHLPACIEAAAASRHDIRVVLGTMGEQPAPAVHDATVVSGLTGGKFPNANAALRAAGPPRPRWTIVIDEDVRLPERFFDRFIAIAETFDFAIAQPALSLRSFFSYRLNRRRPLAIARETRFVEIGPLTAFRADAAARLIPFPEETGMGWGLDVHWPAVAAREGWRMGVVDATPIGHEQAPFGATYSVQQAQRDEAAWLRDAETVPRSEALRTVATHRRLPA